MTMRVSNRTKLVLASLAVVIAPASGLTAVQPATQGIEGSWRGDFGAGPWTFTFVRGREQWSGSYTYPKYAGVNPVTNLSVAENSATFSINARTSVDFNLRLDRSMNTMSGTVRFGQGVTAGSAPVVVPVRLERIP